MPWTLVSLAEVFGICGCRAHWLPCPFSSCSSELEGLSGTPWHMNLLLFCLHVPVTLAPRGPLAPLKGAPAFCLGVCPSNPRPCGSRADSGVLVPGVGSPGYGPCGLWVGCPARCSGCGPQASPFPRPSSRQHPIVRSSRLARENFQSICS